MLNALVRHLSDNELRRLQYNFEWRDATQEERSLSGVINSEIKKRANDKECRKKYLEARGFKG